MMIINHNPDIDIASLIDFLEKRAIEYEKLVKSLYHGAQSANVRNYLICTKLPQVADMYVLAEKLKNNPQDSHLILKAEEVLFYEKSS